ncbi:tRNA (adenosine(37)-N6)-dimethylallyltransferase MiaA [Enterococcus sp. LJL98]
MKKIMVIVGPTAVGKTALSIELAKKYNGEIINADSMQVFRGLDIGTAKVTKEEAMGVPHHLIDLYEMDQTYTVADFQKMAREKIEEISQRGKLPIVVGGTGLYVQALIYDYQLGKQSSPENSELRKTYTKYGEEKGAVALWELLQARDPLAAEKIHFNNQRKVIRALEVFELTGQSILAPKETPKKLYDDFLIGLTTDRALLYERINQRVVQMLENGLLEEARTLLPFPGTQAALGIGYQEFFPYFEGEVSLDSVIETIQLHSRRYAKRQLTWFRNRMAPKWFDFILNPESFAQLENQIEEWLKGSE